MSSDNNLNLNIIRSLATFLLIDKRLRELDYNNILELTSGFSFRGLGICNNLSIHYINPDNKIIFQSFRSDQNGVKSY